jgi:hypothetical protein
MLRVFYFCRACGKTFAIVAPAEPTDMTDRQRGTPSG